ncbi:MAG: hypothetical protein VX726_09180, partial [Planctomycetota bacterium]|nr:hypothetical protein [Planctomycetota bacterium]
MDHARLLELSDLGGQSVDRAAGRLGLRLPGLIGFPKPFTRLLELRPPGIDLLGKGQSRLSCLFELSTQCIELGVERLPTATGFRLPFREGRTLGLGCGQSFRGLDRGP